MEVLYEGGETIRHVYFPDDELISLLVVLDDKTVREIGVIGSEGMLGTAVALGMKTTLTRALIQLPGSAMRMKAGALRDELGRGGALPDVRRDVVLKEGSDERRVLRVDETYVLARAVADAAPVYSRASGCNPRTLAAERQPAALS